MRNRRGGEGEGEGERSESDESSLAKDPLMVPSACR